MIELTELVRAGAEYECSQQLLLDPTCIEQARPTEMPGYDDDCCKLTVGEELLFVAGTLDTLAAAIDSDKERALDKLAAIRAIVIED